MRAWVLGGVVTLSIGLLVGAALGYAIGRAGQEDAPTKPPAERRVTAVGPAVDDEVVDRCVDLWNAPVNATRQRVLRDWRRTRNLYVHVGSVADFPDECQVTAGITGPGAIALVFQQVGGAEQSGETFGPGGGLQRRLAALPTAQKAWNAEVGDDGTLRARRP